eukprot:TRINITY_DN1189_c0_g1_i1.p1 TRINITY_DN1189_c0_g1~~TRINITY_DN1189_c0_g1_i1.p1  ORF type:complete len:430 (-),score=81.56 TRINITY_DN1189_c0_g1_i1:2129-3376(-)
MEQRMPVQLKRQGTLSDLRSLEQLPRTFDERVRKARQEYKLLGAPAKWLLRVVVIETIILIAFSIAVTIMFRYASVSAGVVHDDFFMKELAYSLVAIVNVLFFLYFAFDGVLYENKFEMAAFGLTSILLTTRVVFFYATEKGDLHHLEHSVWYTPILALALAVMCATLLLQFVIAVLFLLTWRAFGWKMWKQVQSADKLLLSAFSNYQTFMSILKIDFQFAVSLLVLGGFFLFEGTANTSYALYLDIVVVVLSGIWAVCGWQIMRREFRFAVIPFIGWFIVEPSYIVYKIATFYPHTALIDPPRYANCDYIPCATFTVYGVSAILIRVVLFIMSVRCVRNFDMGLKRVFGTASTEELVRTATVTNPSLPLVAHTSSAMMQHSLSQRLLPDPMDSSAQIPTELDIPVGSPPVYVPV